MKHLLCSLIFILYFLGSQAACVSDVQCLGGRCHPSLQECVDCLSNADCTSSTAGICDTGINECVQCTSFLHCSAPEAVCYMNECVECSVDSHCTSTTNSKCDQSTNTCTSCTVNIDCHFPLETICYVDTCVQCLVNTDCTSPSAAKCSSKVCVPCTSQSDCGHFILENKCLTTTSPAQCVQCRNDVDCSGTTPKCSPTSYTCVECLADTDCTTVTASKCSSNTCTPCTSHSHCPFPTTSRCSIALAMCVECLSDSDCGGTKPRCSTSTGACVQCLSNTDCFSSAASSCSLVSPTANTCITCSQDQHCTHIAGKNRCNTGLGECVECMENSDCPSLYTSSQCDHTTNTCVNPSPSSCESNPTLCLGTDYPLCDTTNNRCRKCAGDPSCTSQLSTVTNEILQDFSNLNLESLSPSLVSPNSYSCTTCSDNGVCQYQQEYLENRCLCNQGWTGAQCSLSTQQSREVSEYQYHVLQSLLQVVQNSSSLTDMDVSSVSAILESVSASNMVSNETLTQLQLKIAEVTLQKIKDSGNYSLLTSAAAQNLADFASNILLMVFQNDCLLTKDSTKQTYNDTLQLMQDISFITAQNLPEANSTSNSSTALISTDLFKLLIMRGTLGQLYQSTPVSFSDDTPAFQLTGDLNASTQNEKIDLYSTVWNQSIIECPNATQPSQANQITFQINKQGSNETFATSQTTQLRIYYPMGSKNYTTCMKGCQPTVVPSETTTVELSYFVCLCKNLSQLSPQEQILSVFKDSNLYKIFGFDALRTFQPWKSVTFWVLATFNVTFVIGTSWLFRKKEKQRKLKQIHRLRNPYLKAFLVNFAFKVC